MKQKANTIGIDLAKQTFHLVGTDTKGKIVWRKKLSRKALMPFMAQLPPALIGMEACGGAHYWARQFRQQGHEVKLMAPQFVKPYVKSNKNDMRDAEAIAEAVTPADHALCAHQGSRPTRYPSIASRSGASNERTHRVSQRDARASR